MSGKVLQLIECARVLGRLPVCPSDRFGVLQKDTTSRGARKAITDARSLLLATKGFPPRHLQRMCSSRECALPLQVPHHKTDTEGILLSGSQTASFVSKHSHKEAHRDHFATRVVSWCRSSLWLWQACRCLPWIRCLSCRGVCYLLFSIRQASVLATSFRVSPAVPREVALLS